MAQAEKKQAIVLENVKGTAERETCGLIMPIAAMGEYSESHWTDVLDILKDSLSCVQLDANLVSYAEETSLIHTTIVQNLFDNPIVVCDVSGKNPNVMFELGLRLAFDKPTIIVKDDSTGYSFDTGGIEHLTYPRDLRFGRIVDFKRRLGEKARSTLDKAKADSGYSTFLKHFKRVTVAKLEDKEVTGQEYVLEELRAMRKQLSRISQVREDFKTQVISDPGARHGFVTNLYGMDKEAVQRLEDRLLKLSGIKTWNITGDPGAQRIELEFDLSTSPAIRRYIVGIITSSASGFSIDSSD